MWDLDAMTYERRPGPRATPFDHDWSPQAISRVTVWPAVGGRSFVWFDDAETPELLEHYRVSSTITDIRGLSGTDTVVSSAH